jgi:hypothetical protein
VQHARRLTPVAAERHDDCLDLLRQLPIQKLKKSIIKIRPIEDLNFKFVWSLCPTQWGPSHHKAMGQVYEAATSFLDRRIARHIVSWNSTAILDTRTRIIIDITSR